MINRKRIAGFAFALLILLIIFQILYRINLIPHKKYSDSDFGITFSKSKIDTDCDDIDDRTDFLLSAKAYVETKPSYKSIYYAGGYPNDGHGVCTDVVGFGLLGAGIDLMELVNEDIINNKDIYNIEKSDKNIDFRRVVNLNIYFQRNAVSLTTDVHEIEEWQGGDIVVFTKHIGVVSDNRNRNGVPFVIHHANPNQIYYEEDILESRDDIIGHYRLN